MQFKREKWELRQMQVSHPKQYDYCMRPVDQGGLGMAEVLDYIGVDH